MEFATEAHVEDERDQVHFVIGKAEVTGSGTIVSEQVRWPWKFTYDELALLHRHLGNELDRIHEVGRTAGLDFKNLYDNPEQPSENRKRFVESWNAVVARD